MTDADTLRLDARVAQIRDWLRGRIEGATDLEITEVTVPAQGFSSETILFRATWQEAGERRERDLVARIQRETGCPMLGDVFHQYHVMAAAQGRAPVPTLVAAEADPAFLGAPFFLMDRVEGRVPSDFPSYHVDGWFAHALDAADRERAWWNGVRAMETLHRIDWRDFTSLTAAGEPEDARFFLRHFIMPWYEWAAQGQSYPLIDRALAHLLADAPPAARCGLAWNDARLGNTMFTSDLEVASLFDFEVASLGPAEIDLAWWIYMDDVFSAYFGHERISGIPGRDASLAGFERIYGRAMPDFAYYEAIAALKHAVISIRDYGNGKRDTSPNALPAMAAERLTAYLDGAPAPAGG